MKSAVASMACIGLLVSTGAVPLLAQMQKNNEKKMTCGNRNRGYDGDGARHCDIREQALPSIGRLNVEGHNGSATVKGWLRSDVLLRARVDSAADTQSDADLLASRISIDTAGGLRAFYGTGVQ
jgi:hypothetical protein